MELWQRTREFGRGTEVPEDDIAKARGKLVAQTQGAAAPSRARSPRRPVWIGAGALAGAAAVTVGVLLIAQNQSVPTLPEAIASPTPVVTPKPVPTPTPTPTAEPAMTAQGALASAAAQIGAHAPQLAEGQYLRVDWYEETVALGDGTFISEPGWAVGHTTATRAWQSARSGTTYIPADVRGEWYNGPTAAPHIIAVFGADSSQDEEYAAMLEALTWGGGWAEGGGGLPEGDGVPKGTMLTEVSPDPNDILDWHRAQLGEGMTPERRDVVVGWRLILLLAANAGSPDIRAGMFLALSALPDASIIDQIGTQYTVAFETGDFGQTDGGDYGVRRHTITFDAATGLVSALSSRMDPGPGIVPSSVPDEYLTYAISVVDEVPAP